MRAAQHTHVRRYPFSLCSRRQVSAGAVFVEVALILSLFFVTTGGAFLLWWHSHHRSELQEGVFAALRRAEGLSYPVIEVDAAGNMIPREGQDIDLIFEGRRQIIELLLPDQITLCGGLREYITSEEGVCQPNSLDGDGGWVRRFGTCRSVDGEVDAWMRQIVQRLHAGRSCPRYIVGVWPPPQSVKYLHVVGIEPSVSSWQPALLEGGV